MFDIVKICSDLAKEFHYGQVDKAGVDYYKGHLTAVASGVDYPIEKCVAYLHDSLEDTDLDTVTLAEILSNEGISLGDTFDIVDAVEALTKVKGEPYSIYLERVKRSPLATKVKISDLIHNSDLSRLSSVTDADIKRTEKYKKAIEFLG
jgi:(p)ppGpp synthase/HD superfamily hydrolase